MNLQPWEAERRIEQRQRQAPDYLREAVERYEKESGLPRTEILEVVAALMNQVISAFVNREDGSCPAADGLGPPGR